MAIAAPPSTPTFSASFRPTRLLPSRASLPSSLPTTSFILSARLNSVSPENGDLQGELFHGLSPQRRVRGSPVFVTMPVDSVDPLGGQVWRRKTMSQSFKALGAAGVKGVVMEVWWGIEERDQPGLYNWQGYLAIVDLAKRCGLKVRVVLTFHQLGTGPGDPYWIPLPQWVLDEIDKDPDLAYSDRFGRRRRTARI